MTAGRISLTVSFRSDIFRSEQRKSAVEWPGGLCDIKKMTLARVHMPRGSTGPHPPRPNQAEINDRGKCMIKHNIGLYPSNSHFEMISPCGSGFQPRKIAARRRSHRFCCKSGSIIRIAVCILSYFQKSKEIAILKCNASKDLFPAGPAAFPYVDI